MDDMVDSPLGFWGSSAEEMLASHFPIHRACRDGDPIVLSRLVADATPEQLVLEDQFYSWTPVHWAAYFGKNECLNGLLQCGVNVNIRTTQFKQAPIHIATFGERPDTLLALLKAGADFEARDFLGESALHKAARVGNAGCIRTLLAHGTPVSTCNSNGLTACDLARQQGFHECVHVLEKAQASMNGSSCFQANGIQRVNGSSGLTMNGHQNGVDGHTSKSCNRKRPCDDISMPFIKRSRTSEDELLFCESLTVSGINSSSKFSSEVVMEGESSNTPNSAYSHSATSSSATPRHEATLAAAECRGFPQYEDEVFCTDIDFPYGFWSENQSSNDMATSYACNPP